MVDQYTGKVRRTSFFAQYEACLRGSDCVETEHLLLGLLRESKALAYRYFVGSSSLESIREQIEPTVVSGCSNSTVTALPLSDPCRRVLAYAGQEAETLSHRFIGTEHLLLGLMREESCLGAQLLKQRGVFFDDVRTNLHRESGKLSPEERLNNGKRVFHHYAVETGKGSSGEAIERTRCCTYRVCIDVQHA